MSHLIEAIQGVKAQKMEEIARKEAEKRAKEDKKQQLRLGKEKFMEECHLQCQQVIDESPCQKLLQEVNTEVFKGKGKIFKTKGIDQRVSGHDIFGRYEEIYPSVGLVLERKRVKLETVAIIHIDRRERTESPVLAIRCYSNPKKGWDFSAVLLKEIKSPDQPNMVVVQEWKDENKVRKAIARVLVEKGVA